MRKKLYFFLESIINWILSRRRIVLIILGWIIVLTIIFYGQYIGKDNFSEKTIDIVSCNDYEEEFLKSIGFKNLVSAKEECRTLNLAIYRAAVTDCLKDLKVTSDKKEDKLFLDECVYYSVAKSDLPTKQEYLIYFTGK